MRVLIEFEKKPVLFSEPEFIIACTDPSDLGDCFKEMESANRSGYYLAGFMSYEAGYCFEKKLEKNKPYDFPLVYLGAYKKPQPHTINLSQSFSKNHPQNLKLDITKNQYAKDISAIRNYIAQGDVYQITYCIKLLFNFNGCADSLYRQLLKEQPVPYPAYIQTEKFQILSLSPELFIKKNATHLISKPMKGTWPRGDGLFADLLAPWRLKFDSKNRAENVMIADLLRNDLGRLGEGIKAPTLFEVARYKTLCQMTSTISAKVAQDISLYKLFASIFPSGSVTGAPKISAMEIIHELEGQERKIYTGAIGYITPQKDMFFNIPIRTLLIQGNSGEMGIGGGIVWDSTVDGEWGEGLLKAKFFTDLCVVPFNPV